MTRLLDKNIENRLCVHEGLEELKKHPFFQSIDFDAIQRKEIEAPYIPKIKDNSYISLYIYFFMNFYSIVNHYLNPLDCYYY